MLKPPALPGDTYLLIVGADPAFACVKEDSGLN
jgi:hypothetical protein